MAIVIPILGTLRVMCEAQEDAWKVSLYIIDSLWTFSSFLRRHPQGATLLEAEGCHHVPAARQPIKGQSQAGTIFHQAGSSRQETKHY